MQQQQELWQQYKQCCLRQIDQGDARNIATQLCAERSDFWRYMSFEYYISSALSDCGHQCYYYTAHAAVVHDAELMSALQSRSITSAFTC
jgi:hypothetical protein